MPRTDAAGRLGRALAVLALPALALPLAGCSAFHLPSGPNDDAHLTARILVDLPPQLRGSAQMAVDEVNAERRSEFEKVTLTLEDLGGGAQPGDVSALKEQLRGALGDNTVMGLIGPRSTQEARALLPIANNGGLAVISPSLVDDCLTAVHVYCTRGEPFSLRPHNGHPGQAGDLSFFRIPAPLSTQGSAGAILTVDTLQKSSVVVVQDATTFSRRLVDAYTGFAQIKGATIIDTLSIDSSQRIDARTLAATLVEKHPDLVLLATDRPAAVLAVGAALSGTPSTLMVPDAVHTDDIATAAAGWKEVTVLATSLAADPSRRSASFTGAWQKLNHTAALPPPFALETYLATRALIDAIRVSTLTLVTQQINGLPTADSVRTAVAGVAEPTDDLIGVSFGAGGDDNSQLVTLQRAQGGVWTTVDSLQAPG